jgi:hypothetical protein
METLTQQYEIVIYRHGNAYAFGRYIDGVEDGDSERDITPGEAQRIVSLHPDGKTDNGGRADFAHTPCHWRWSVQVQYDG